LTISKGISAGSIEDIIREYVPKICGVNLYTDLRKFSAGSDQVVYKADVDVDNIDTINFSCTVHKGGGGDDCKIELNYDGSVVDTITESSADSSTTGHHSEDVSGDSGQKTIYVRCYCDGSGSQPGVKNINLIFIGA